MKHELKILPAYFEAVLSGEKTFEIRNNNDRGFQKGDTLVLREFDPDLSSSTLAMCYTGRTIERVVSYVSNYEQQPGFVVLGLKQQRLPEGGAVNVSQLDRYDAGYLNDFGGGDVNWWHDYIRTELDRAHDFYQSQVEGGAA